MSRLRRSSFTAMSIPDGNSLNEQAHQMMRSSRQDAPGRPDMRAETIEGRAAALQPMRNTGAAAEGLRQKDVRASHRGVGGAPDVPTAMFRPGRRKSSSGDGLYNGLVGRVVGARNAESVRRRLFSR